LDVSEVDFFSACAVPEKEGADWRSGQGMGSKGQGVGRDDQEACGVVYVPVVADTLCLTIFIPKYLSDCTFFFTLVGSARTQLV